MREMTENTEYIKILNFSMTNDTINPSKMKRAGVEVFNHTRNKLQIRENLKNQ